MSSVTVASACDVIDTAAIDQAQILAATQGVPLEAAWRLISTEFLRRCRARSPVSLEADGRATKWRCRVRLYNMNRPDEPEADSDPDSAADAPGAVVLGGLPAVADWLATLAYTYHNGANVSGLDLATLRHRLKALRPTISRRGGNAVWRVPYTVSDLAWMARVDVVRVETKETEK